MTQAVLADWRKAQIEGKLRAMIEFLEKLILTPDDVKPADAAVLRKEGLTDRAIIDAIYISAGFSIIVRIADALSFKVPPDKVFDKAAKFLLLFGYKTLSGRLFGHTRNYKRTVNIGVIDDPYKDGIEQLREAVLFSSGFLDPSIRMKAAEAGDIAGTLGEYVKKVAYRATEITDDDITLLRQDGYSEDEIFEATVSAALGAGLLRLNFGLESLQK